MGANSALRARIRHAKKKTKIGKLLAKTTKDLRKK